MSTGHEEKKNEEDKKNR